MPQRPLLVKLDQRRDAVQAHEPLAPGQERPIGQYPLWVRWADKLQRRAGSTLPHYDVVGVDRQELAITWGSIGTHVRTADELKRYVRRLRPDEAARLDAIDQQLAALQAQRRELMQRAWVKAHTVTWAELAAVADAHAEARSRVGNTVRQTTVKLPGAKA